jgi:hypothetical protein
MVTSRNGKTSGLTAYSVTRETSSKPDIQAEVNTPVLSQRIAKAVAKKPR